MPTPVTEIDPVVLETRTQPSRTKTPCLDKRGGSWPSPCSPPTYTQDPGTALVLLQSDFHYMPRGREQDYVTINKPRLAGLQNAAVKCHHLFPWGVT